MMNPYTKLLNKKRKWTPVAVNAGPVVEGAEEALLRCLAIRHMELPVGEFIREALDRDIPALSTDLLRSNIVDEERHDLALNFVATAHKVDPRTETEAMRLRDAWEAHPDHTILKALVAERAIFFVLLPFFRFNGDAGMRTTSADISRDEQVHVACNSLICEELGLTPSQSLDKLRKATIHWVLDPLKSNENKYLDKDFWLRSSDNLMYTGKAPELVETQRSRMPAFFEHSNVNLPQYA
jgi:PAS domain-containing protein